MYSVTSILTGMTLAAALLAPVAANAAEGFATANVNMRSGPSTRYPAVVVIPVGAPVEIHGCLADANWCDVSFARGRGWVSGSYVQAEYQRGRVYVAPRYYRPLGIPTVTFELGSYWDRNYRNRDFYRDRDYWRGGPGRFERDRDRYRDGDRDRYRDRDRDRYRDGDRDRYEGRDRDRFEGRDRFEDRDFGRGDRDRPRFDRDRPDDRRPGFDRPDRDRPDRDRSDRDRQRFDRDRPGFNGDEGRDRPRVDRENRERFERDRRDNDRRDNDRPNVDRRDNSGDAFDTLNGNRRDENRERQRDRRVCSPGEPGCAL